MRRNAILGVFAVWISVAGNCVAQSAALVALDQPASPTDFPIAANAQASAIYVAPQNPETVRVAAEAFASDVEKVTGVKPRILTSLAAPPLMH